MANLKSSAAVSVFIILLTTLYTHAQSPAPESSNPNFFGAEYFVLNPDVKLVYESTFGETECITRFEGNEYVQEFTGGDFKMVQKLNLDDEKLSVSMLEQELKVLFITAHSIHVTYSEPATLVSIPVERNVKSEWNGLEYINDEPGDSIVITSEYVGSELIKTEAGNFECIKLAYIITKKSGKVNKYYEWRAPNVGLVKLTAEVDKKGFVGFITELLGYDKILFILKEIES